VRRDHVEAYLENLYSQGRSASTVATRFRALQQLFKWLADEGEIARSPMERMKPPLIPEVPVPVLSEPLLKRLLDTCAGKAFEDRRDAAMIRLFIDTGSTSRVDKPRTRVTEGQRYERLDLGIRELPGCRVRSQRATTHRRGQRAGQRGRPPRSLRPCETMDRRSATRSLNDVGLVDVFNARRRTTAECLALILFNGLVGCVDHAA